MLFFPHLAWLSSLPPPAAASPPAAAATAFQFVFVGSVSDSRRHRREYKVKNSDNDAVRDPFHRDSRTPQEYPRRVCLHGFLGRSGGILTVWTVLLVLMFRCTVQGNLITVLSRQNRVGNACSPQKVPQLKDN